MDNYPVHLKKVQPLDSRTLEKIGFTWHTDSDDTPYIADELVVVTPQEAEAFEKAANELYDMFVEAGEYVIERGLYHELGIPFNLVDLIESSWENDVHWHLYGRFDFAGGIGGAPVKLLEFNADTPTSLFETAVIQWAILKQNGMEESRQFNALYEALVENFKRIVTLEEDTSAFAQRYEGWKFLFSSVAGNTEEEQTVRLLEHIAKEAGFETAFAYAHETAFDGEEGIFYQDRLYELWFKLLPWEEIALEEPDLALLLTQIVSNQKAIVFNPAYTLLFQSKGMLAVLWELFEGHPLLLESSFEPIPNQAYVQKPLFGREGESVRIFDSKGGHIAGKSGAYDRQKKVYQAYVPLNSDAKGRRYQAGVFYAYEACALGFRRGGEILDNMSKFVGHIVT